MTSYGPWGSYLTVLYLTPTPTTGSNSTLPYRVIVCLPRTMLAHQYLIIICELFYYRNFLYRLSLEKLSLNSFVTLLAEFREDNLAKGCSSINQTES